MKPLVGMADIRVSNVDKKISHGEKPVKLCNYMDVYSNIYVTRELDFMNASASRSEIERFTLKRGDVVITKDSETPDDIGIPAVIVDGIADLVCGYHLALIRPHPEDLDSVFLAKQLATPRVARFFGQRAAGSTRYGLPTSAIESVTVPAPPKPEQEKIAQILMAVDQAITDAARFMRKHQRIKTGLVDDLLTRGIDERGVARMPETHEFQDSPLGPIPADWRCQQLSYFVPSAEYGISTSLGDSGQPVLRMNNLADGEADLSDLKYTDAPVPEQLWLRPGDVLFNRTNSWEHVGRTGIWRGQRERVTFASYLVRLNADLDRLSSGLLNLWLNWSRTQIRTRRYATPAVQQVNINPTNLRMLPAAFPSSPDEQAAIVERIDGQNAAIRAARSTLDKLRALRRGLMQDLLSGRKRVTPLLDTAQRDLEQAS
jgi:type I restriction enzyme S subunit